MITSVGPFSMITETDMERYRAETFLTKEPETLAWIDHIKPGEILLDVGANIGIYTLYAASRGITVYAFEPMAENYHHLVRNIEHNGYRNAVALPWAISSGDMRMDRIYLPKIQAGASGGQIGAAQDENGKSFIPARVRLVTAMGLWKACELLNLEYEMVHIKVDVDGHEKDICHEIFMNGPHHRLSMLVEINLNAWPLDDAIETFGFWRMTADNEFNRHPQHSRYRRQREGIAAENGVFTRR
ncbi:MAG: FkbM family methyltransferase [Syntrophaceae bacterium]